MKHNLKHIAYRFQIPGRYAQSAPYGSGHINDTYAVWFFEAPRAIRYIFQRVNHEVFRDVPALMKNIARVLRHLRKKVFARGRDDVGRNVLTLIPTLEGDEWLRDEEGNYWRAYLFIEGARTWDLIEKPKLAEAAARAFGRFLCDLSDLPASELNETIPNFHHTRSRFDEFVKALEADSAGRAASARDEIAFAFSQESVVDVLLKLQATGELPERVTHNDTKLNNVMIDTETQEGICVIDLDTVMPGLALYDFGDMVRTATNTGGEDERDLSRIRCNPVIFEALAKGYLAAAGDVLSPREIELLPFAGKLITLETGLRFLTDYLSGDVYFKTRRDSHNLDRCRTQFALVRSISSQEENLTTLLAGMNHSSERI